jgi:asparagine synthase (glutamine-hydrolysing)
MTAIAGVVGALDEQLDRTCAAILAALAGYGTGAPRCRAMPGASFCRAPSRQLSEDDFGEQPLVDPDRFLLVADARLDNRGDLIRKLGIAERAARYSDASILLQAWIRWNESCLDRLVGDFAFAVWDSAERRLTLARDPTGQRPLFYAHDGASVAFASMPAGLAGLPWMRSGFRFERLATMLLGITDFTEETHFRGVSRVRPGGLAVFDSAGARNSVYWSPSTEPLRLGDDEFVEAYREQLERAVGCQLRRTPGGVGVHLSSGYDSSAVAATAARIAGEPKPIAFTGAPREGFDGPVQRNRIADESELAAETARMYGLRHIVVRPSGGVLQLLRGQARLYQEPDRNVINMEWWTAIHRAARDLGVSTMLVAQLGNLTIHAGGLPALGDLLRNGDWLEWAREAWAAGRSGKARWRAILMFSLEGRLAPSIVRSIYRRHVGVPLDFESSYVHDHWLRASRGKSDESARKLLEGSSSDRRLTLIRSQDIGVFRKGALAESGIDERDPTADRRLVEFSLRLPPDQRLHRGEWRPLARRALRGRVPESILDLDVRGYQGADWFERVSKMEALGVVEEISTSSAVNDLLDLEKIRRDIDNWPSQGSANLYDAIIFRTRLLTALSTGVFLQELEPLVSGPSSHSS